ncbi:MAG: site-specific integrase [Moorella sp. (in: firmicutes)]
MDLATGTVHVQQAMQRIREPKTKKSRRQIVLPAAAIDMLRKLKAKQARNKLLAGPAYNDMGLVFCRPNGEPLDPSYVSRRFHAIAVKAGLAGIHFHSLRHTHATLLLTQGVHPKVVQERLGHGSINITLDTYSHVLPSLQEEAAKKLDRIFGHQLGTKP